MSDQMDQASVPSLGSSVRIAYTLNNEQPVRCTYVSEEPLFYLDAPIIEDEAEDMADFGLPADCLLDIPAGVAPLPSHAEPMALFAEQFGHVPMAAPTTLDDLFAVLRTSRMAEAMLEFVTQHGVSIRFADQIDAASYDRNAHIISLRHGLSFPEQVVLLTRELRRVWQHRRGILLHPLMFHPDHAIIINRVQAADLMTMMVRVAWELRLAGSDDAWAHLEHSGHYDMTRSFAREASADFRALNNGQAAAAAFESWFMSERCRSFDRLLIQQMLADYQTYVFRAGNEETSKVITQQLVAALGDLPYGKNYLSAHAATVLADPIFTDIRDRSNANFLWFIKFEQSFRQTERDLQQEEGSTTSAAISGVPVDKDRSANASTSATIIHLPTRATDARVLPKVAGNGGAVIVDLQGWRGSGPVRH